MNLSLKLVECRFFLFNDPIRSILPENFKLQVYELKKKNISNCKRAINLLPSVNIETYISELFAVVKLH